MAGGDGGTEGKRSSNRISIVTIVFLCALLLVSECPKSCVHTDVYGG